jgi:hypothetical protein
MGMIFLSDDGLGPGRHFDGWHNRSPPSSQSEAIDGLLTWKGVHFIYMGAETNTDTAAYLS